MADTQKTAPRVPAARASMASAYARIASAQTTFYTSSLILGTEPAEGAYKLIGAASCICEVLGRAFKDAEDLAVLKQEAGAPELVSQDLYDVAGALDGVRILLGMAACAVEAHNEA